MSSSSSNKLSEPCERILSFLLDKKSLIHQEQTSKTKKIFKTLYRDLLEADTHTPDFNPEIIEVSPSVNIPKPKNFGDNAFPIGVQEHIDSTAKNIISYTFSLLERNIKVNIVVEESVNKENITKYNEYVRKLLIWLTIIHKYTRYGPYKTCSKTLTFYIYLTSLKKQLPDNNKSILTQNHVNTAFTSTCPYVSEIVIFREEEKLRAGIHETMHNFALDFSDMDMTKCHAKILSIFPVKSEVNLFEAYTEFWAKIINVVFCSYFLNGNNTNEKTFLHNVDVLINFEIAFCFLQMVKVLEFMGLKYSDLYNPKSEQLRSKLYKEDTNVLSYYVLALILLNNYQGFLEWCEEYNVTLLQFKKSEANLMGFCEFIEKNYTSKSMLAYVSKMERLNKVGSVDPLIKSSARLSAVELG